MEINSTTVSRYELIFKRYYSELVRHAFALVQDIENAKDIVQDTFLSLIKNDVLLRDLENIEGYLHRSVHNNALYWLRKQKRVDQELPNLLRDLQSEEMFTGPDEETFEKIHTIVQSLPPQQQKAVTLVYFEQMKYQEAANSLGISINTFKTNLRLALHSIRQRMSFIYVFIHPLLCVMHCILK